MLKKSVVAHLLKEQSTSILSGDGGRYYFANAIIGLNSKLEGTHPPSIEKAVEIFREFPNANLGSTYTRNAILRRLAEEALIEND